MKRAACLCLLLLVLGMHAMADPVSPARSRRVAADFWNAVCMKDGKTVDTLSLSPVSLSDFPHLHVYRCGGGFVVMAADDAVPPVLAYSPDTPFPATPHPALRAWLASYEAQINDATERELPVAAGWDSAGNGTDSSVPHATSHIGAMVTTMWNQSDPYNVRCPYDSARNERTVVGCVATAMAQIMKYWNHPLCGEGSHSYTYRSYGTLSADFGATSYIWEYMPPVLTNASQPTSRETLQTLSFHCGVAVNMMYGPSSTGGSGAYSHNVPAALATFFKYKPTMAYRERGDFSDSVWVEMILADLNARRPIYYSGRDSSGGHAFVLDGADTLGRYHFNFGWGGYGDGYYRIDNIAPGGGGAGSNRSNTFNLAQAAIFGIEPIPQQYDTVDYYDTVCNTSFSFDFYDYKLPPRAADYTLHHLDTIYRVHVAMADRRFIYLDPNEGEGSIRQAAYCYLTGAQLPPNPFVRAGHRFVGWCLDINGNDSVYQPGDTLHIRTSRVVYAIWQDTVVPPVPVTDSTDTDVIVLYPNPTQSKVTIDLGGIDEAQCELRDAVGRLVRQIEITSGSAIIDLEGVAEGMYILHINDGQHIYNRRIIKY